VGPTDTEPGDVFARYVWPIDLEGRGVVLRHEDADWTYTSSAGYVFSIRLPYSDGTQMTLGFKSKRQKELVSVMKNSSAPLLIAVIQTFLANDLCTFWRLRPVANRSEKVVENKPIATNEIVVEGGGVKKTVITTMSMTTTTKTVTRVVPSDG